MTAVPCVTLWQPWASLIALGVKTIETRSWRPPAKYVGQTIGIHAAKRQVRLHDTPEGMIGPFRVYRDGPGEPQYMIDGRQNVQYPIDLPLGAVVCTARLVACLPMADGHTDWTSQRPCLTVESSLWVHEHIGQISSSTDVSAQRPYGDFAPGRWAWMLDEITPLPEPVPAVGRQGFFTVELP